MARGPVFHPRQVDADMTIHRESPWEAGLATSEPVQQMAENVLALRTDAVLSRRPCGCEACGREGIPLLVVRVAAYVYAALCARCKVTNRW